MVAKSINGLEFCVMMERVALRRFLERVLGQALDANCLEVLEKWNKASKEVRARMPGLKGVSWRSIHYPFGMSLDHAPIHKQFRLRMLTPRVDRLVEWATVFAAAERELGIPSIADADKIKTVCDEFMERAKKQVNAAHLGSAARKKAAARKSTLARTIENIEKKCAASPVQFLADVLCGSFSRSPAQKAFAKKIADKVMAEYKAKNAAYGDDDTCWEEVFRRRMAASDPRWMCFLPEQFLPLGDGTPDLHQTAEMQVSLNKRVMRQWAQGKDPDSPDLKKARCYAEEMHTKCRERNAGDNPSQCKDAKSIQASIYDMWVTAQIVAADFGKEFAPRLLPGTDGNGSNEFTTAAYTVEGTGGRFPPDKWS